MSKRTFEEIQAEVAEQAKKSRSYMVPRELVREAFLAKYPNYEAETKPKLDEIAATRSEIATKLVDVDAREKQLREEVEVVRSKLTELERQLKEQSSVGCDLREQDRQAQMRSSKIRSVPEVLHGKLFDKVLRGKNLVDVPYDPEHIK